MIVYRLCVSPSEYDGEGEDHDLWFSSLREAKRVRTDLIRADPGLLECKYDHDYAIERVEVGELSKKQLLLNVLNRKYSRWIKKQETMVRSYTPTKKVKVKAVQDAQQINLWES